MSCDIGTDDNTTLLKLYTIILSSVNDCIGSWA